MLIYEFLLAASLLIQAPDNPATEVDPAQFYSIRLTTQLLAVEWEIMDQREARYMLAESTYLPNNMNLLRRRNVELGNAPMASDALRFPDRATINEYIAINRAYRQYLDTRQPGEPARWWELRTALQETDYLYQVWDAVRDSSCTYYYITVRRQALKNLRDMIGEKAYYSTDLPPHIPTWRFEPITQR